MVRLQKKGLSGFIWVTFQSYLFKSTYISVLSALMWQASLNLSLNSQIKVDTVKNTSFEVILPHRLYYKPNWGQRLKSQYAQSAIIVLKSVSICSNKKKRLIFHAFK